MHVSYRPALYLFLFLLIAGLFAFPCLAESDIKIGWIGPLTGNSAALGMDDMPAVQMAVDEINAQGGIQGRKLRLLVEDDQYSSPKTVAAYQKLVHVEGVKIILAITYSGLFALAPRAEQDKVVLIDALDCDDQLAGLPRHTVCIAKSTENLGYVLAKEVLQDKTLPVGVVYFDGDAFMGTVAKSFSAKLAESGEAPLFMLPYDNNVADFKPLLLKAKTGNVRGMVFLGYDTLGTAIKQLREMGVAGQVYGLTTLLSPGGRELAGDAINGAKAGLWLAPRSPRYEAFHAGLSRRIRRDPLPDVFNVPPYDAMYVIAAALKNGGYDPASAAVRTDKVLDYIYSQKEFSGVSGRFWIDQNGQCQGLEDPVIRTVKDGKLVAR